MTLPLKVAVLSVLDNEALRWMPFIEGVEFCLANDYDSIVHLKGISALVLVPPFNIALVDDLWDRVFTGVTWVHTFSAGIDFITQLVKKRLLERTDITLTNGRGAFSSSLAEYIITAALYFNKQICRLQRNHECKQWEKFKMSVLKGKRMGFLGYGDIAKNTAMMAKTAFGMSIVVYRRNSSKFRDDAQASIVDLVVDTSNELFATCDFVVCTLPGTADTAKFCSSQFELMKPGAVFISCGR
jgi:phosphoglycerate dehydrogenase-like enzyme